MPVPVVDVFVNGPPFALSATPSSYPPAVYLNGLLQNPANYTIVGQSLTFSATDLGDTPEVQVRYWGAQ